MALSGLAMESAAPPGIDGVAGQPANPEITNNQSVGVDEGGIVKQVGRFLVILQDGRLFSADLGQRPGRAAAPRRPDRRLSQPRHRGELV